MLFGPGQMLLFVLSIQNVFYLRQARAGGELTVRCLVCVVSVSETVRCLVYVVSV